MKCSKWLLGAAFAIATFSLLSLPHAYADINNFTVTDFSADYTLTNADPQGEMRIIEHISVNFTDQNHGLLRAIPDTYKGQKMLVQINGVGSPSGAPTQYTTYQQNGNTVLKIGLPDKTVTGDQEYVVDYTVHNVIGFYKDHDELYWDVNGDQWQQTFDHVNVTLHLPPGAKLSHNEPTCYTGGFGSTTQACVMGQDDKVVTSRTLGNLPAGQTLTFVVGFDKGYFKPLNIFQKLANHWQLLVGLIGLPLLVTFFSWLTWWKRGRDARVRSVIIPEYGPPDNMSPLEVGTITDFKLDNRDLTAGIISLAIRGYIKIIETRKDHLLSKDTFDYSLQLTNADFTGLDKYDQEIMRALFDTDEVGTTKDLNSLKNKLFSKSKDLSEDMEQDLTSRGYFRSNPLKSGKVLLTVAIICGGSVFFLGGLLGPSLIFGLAISALVAWVFSSKMPARTIKGVTARNHILGLKLYLQVAEKDRLQKLQAPNAAYAANGGEPVKTVDLFEKLLPYAMVLGVERQWARQFEGLYTQPPTWYTGNMNNFGAYYLASNLSDSFTSTVGQTFTAPTSSGSSGFGGGGFAGGGGGGGGGGGW